MIGGEGGTFGRSGEGGTFGRSGGREGRSGDRGREGRSGDRGREGSKSSTILQTCFQMKFLFCFPFFKTVFGIY